MLTANVDVSDGIVNGARGEGSPCNSSEVTSVVVKFDNNRIGNQLKQAHIVLNFHMQCL